MFETLGRGWEITKLSFTVVRKDSEMLLFPLLGAVFSGIYSFILLWPSLLSRFMASDESSFMWRTTETALCFASYFGVAFIATFFNTCTVYTAKTRFAGGDATFKDSITFALKKIHLIFAWSLLAASVGVLLRALDQFAERMGGLGGMLLNIMQSILGMMWSVLTIFVVPVMVYEGLGPFLAIRRSGEVLKKTWGESLVRHFSFGIIQFFVAVPGIALILFGMFRADTLWFLIPVGLLWLIVTALLFSVVAVVFNTALYEYASTGRIPQGFEGPTLKAAFVQAQPARV
jgi:Family of unknown function (DUF6159)